MILKLNFVGLTIFLVEEETQKYILISSKIENKKQNFLDFFFDLYLFKLNRRLLPLLPEYYWL